VKVARAALGPSPEASSYSDPMAFPAFPAFPAYLLTKSEEEIRPEITELTVDDLPPGGVLVAVDWSAINFKDAMTTRPGNRVARQYPLVPGVELAGSVIESDDPSLRPGQPVLVQGYDLGVAHHGGFAGRARVPAEWVVPLPEDMPPRAAAIIGIAGFTAVLSLHRLQVHGITPDSGPVLVTGASGGVGSTTVALLAHHGFEVVASTGKADEHAYLESLGASRVVGRAFAPEDGRTLGPQLWGAVVDCVGGAALAEAIRTTRYGGAVAASGLTGGNELTTTVYPFIVRGVALLGIDTVATPIEERRALWAAMASEFPMERCAAIVNREIGLGALTDALKQVLDGAVRGRILVDPGR
jgi:acrylyl-CoA reductase (NADPH)